ncbi:MFS transporter [Paraburkholderia sp. A1RI_3L]|uniref:MFS transporter n=1 Tax=Paraburkholderia TaxID=1822464 RepID=UPI0018F37EC9|nr:MFS transporter [Paraburkholderia kururiensis]
MGSLRFIILVFCAAMVGLTLSFANPVISMRALDAGYSVVFIGASATLSGIGSIVLAFMLPTIVSRCGLRWILPISLALGAVAFISVGMAPGIVTQTMARFVFNAAIVAVFVICEYQILSLVSDGDAGRAAGIYAGTMSIGYMVGPLMIDLTGHSGTAPLVLVASCLLIGVSLSLMHGEGSRISTPTTRSVISCLVNRPVSAMASLAFGTIEISMFTVFPVYGERIGMSPQLTALCLSATALGGAAAQFPIGVAADRIGRISMLALLGLAGVVVTLLIPAVTASAITLLVLMTLWGGVANGMYTVGLSLVSVSVHEEQGLSENAAFVGAYHAGFLIGPLTASAALSLFGSSGFIGFVTSIFALSLLLTRRSSKAARVNGLE